MEKLQLGPLPKLNRIGILIMVLKAAVLLLAPQHYKASGAPASKVCAKTQETSERQPWVI